MTYAFLRDTGFNLNESVVTAKQYQQMDILESAFDAIRDGVSNTFVSRTSNSYAYSLIQEILENVKKMLLELVQQALSLLNNLYTNSIKLFEKYAEILKERLPHLDDPVIHDTFSYPRLNDYPVIVRAGTLEKDVNRLINMARDPNGTPSPEKIGGQVDQLLRSFGRAVTKENIDIFDMKNSVERFITKHVRGKKIQTVITADTLDKYIAEIKSYKADRDELLKVKKSVMEEYEALRAIHTKATQEPVAIMKNSIRYQVDPDKEEFLAREYNRYADCHTELLRLFNGYITIYQTAFDTTLRRMMDKYTDRRDFITRLFTSTGIFAAINTKNAVDPIEIDTRKPMAKK